MEKDLACQPDVFSSAASFSPQQISPVERDETARAACLSADGDMLPSAGAAPAVTLTTPAGRRRR
ncbi:hypothetical protein INR49_007690, partial [Caranx melampygus]